MFFQSVFKNALFLLSNAVFCGQPIRPFVGDNAALGAGRCRRGDGRSVARLKFLWGTVNGSSPSDKAFPAEGVLAGGVTTISILIRFYSEKGL